MSSEDNKTDTAKTDTNSTLDRRKFMVAGTAGIAGSLMAGLGVQSAAAQTTQTSTSDKKRVCLLLDTQTHMMPALAKEMATRNHNLVIGNVKDGLPDELEKLGALVEVVPGNLDMTKPDAIQSMVDAAQKRFGRLDSSCIRTGYHDTGDIMAITTDAAQKLYEGNLLSVVYALQALLKPMMAQGSGQIVINTSASGLRPAPAGAMYSACRAGANMLVRNAALTAGPKGVTINATGTYAMDYPGFINDVGAQDPAVRKQVEATLPLGRFVEPAEAAHFVATLIDGVGTGQTAQFFAIDNGWAFQ
jgi:NAD(P)-dependent dehydrogenase (short-subunit alcohol dehydrogenase family)